MDVRGIILTNLTTVLAEELGLSDCPTLDETSTFQDLGVDSLAFSILVARLEGELGYDPFVTLDSAIYPETLGQFISIYLNH
jgi:hypothetical protein